METFFSLLALCEGNTPVTGGFPLPPVDSCCKYQWRRALMFSLNSAWTNGWNNRDVGDFRRHRARYDVIVLCCVMCRHLKFHHENHITLSAIHSKVWLVSRDLHPRKITMLGSSMSQYAHAKRLLAWSRWYAAHLVVLCKCHQLSTRARSTNRD